MSTTKVKDPIEVLKDEFQQVTADLNNINIEHGILNKNVQTAKTKIEAEKETINTYLEQLGFKFDPNISFEDNLVNAKTYLESVLTTSVSQYKAAIVDLTKSLEEAKVLEASLRG